MASVVAYLFLSVYDFGILGILIFAFGVIPLFFSFQMVVAKVSAGKEIFYNDLNGGYKLYYQAQNRGVYSVLVNLLLTLIVASVSIWLSIVLYDFLYPDVLEAAIASIQALPTDIQYYDEMVNAVLGMKDYIYFLICFLPIPFLFFFRRIRKNFLIPYFSFSVGVPMVLAHQLNKRIYAQNAEYIRSASFWPNAFFSLTFYIGFVSAGCAANLFADQLEYVEYLFVIALSGGLLLSSVLVAPLMIVQCFIADHLHGSYLAMVKEQMVRMTHAANEDTAADEDKKREFKQFLDAFQDQIRKEEKVEKKEGKEEAESSEEPSDTEEK